LTTNYDDYDSLFDALTTHPNLSDDLKRSLFFMQSDVELI
jgi:hypothetical protein